MDDGHEPPASADELLERLAQLEAALGQREAELERAHARAQALEAAGDLGSWELEPATGRGHWSPTMFELYHLDPGSPQPSLEDAATLIHPDDQGTVAEHLGVLLATGHAPPIVVRTHPDRGPVRYLRVAVTRAAGPTDTMTVYGAAADVTQQTRVEGELAASARKLEALFENAPYNIFEIGRDRRIRYVNRVAEGYAIDSVLGQRHDHHVPERDRAQLEAEVARVFEQGGEAQVELEDLGGRRWEARYVALPSSEQEDEGLLCFARDVTEERRLEAQMTHAQKLESLGVLAGGIAHDFNNLLVGILGNAELAQMDVAAASPAGESLREIIAASHRAAELCRQMLAYSGKGRFLIQAMDLPRVVREMVHLLEASISKAATLRFEFAPSTEPIEGDAAQVRQIVMNLITNASDALGSGEGVITVSTGTSECDRAGLADTYLREDLPPGRYTFLEVRDTGCGMDRETKRQMFDPFFSSKADGRGLGLAAVLGIVRGHRGAIRVDSEPGQGTTVRVLLPTSDSVDAEVDAAPPTSTWRGSGTVLVVDDEPGVRAVACALLARMGFDTLTAHDGVEALAQFREHQPDIVAVLLDVTMPRMGGEATLAELRRIDPEARVLLSSGYSEQGAAHRSASNGQAGFIQKPYRMSDLSQELQRLLGE